MNHLIWSFETLSNANTAVAAIRNANGDATVDVATHNVYAPRAIAHSYAEYLTGICRGVAYALNDGSIGRKE